MSCTIDAAERSVVAEAAPLPAATAKSAARAATFVVFSGDLDKQLMALTLANTAAASGMQTTLFFTFWGVSALRTRRHVRGKQLIERMFGWMLPRGAGALPMSKLNFGGLGRRLIQWRMRKHGMPSLEQHLDMASALGVRLVACDASLALMGLRAAELRDGVQVGGAAGCLQSAADADIGMVI